MKLNPLLVLLAITASSTIHAQTAPVTDVKSSVVTVKEMIGLDDAQSLKAARESAIKAGLIAEPKVSSIGQKKEVFTPHWTVRSIFGKANQLKVDVSVDTLRFNSIEVGHAIAACRVETIADLCITTTRINNKSKDFCPSKVCWTGNEIAAEMNPVQLSPVASAPMGVTPMPAPLPLPAPVARPR